MESNALSPRIIYFHDPEISPAGFLDTFGGHFGILASSDERQVAEWLRTESTTIHALILDMDDLDSPTRALAKQANPQILIIQLHEKVELENIVALLDSGLTDRCFTKPYDANVLRSEIYSVSLGLQTKRSSDQDGDGIPDRIAVLIVDDETVATRFLVKQLNKINDAYDTLVASDAESALKLLKTEAHRIAVVISDQRMPGMQGNRLLREIQSGNPNIVRILTSAYEEIDVALNAVNEGQIFRYIRKPWNAAEIDALISKAIQQYQQSITETAKSQASVDQRISQTLSERKTQLSMRLKHCLSDINAFASLEKFYQCLDDIQPLKLSQGSLRAAQDDIFEQELVSSFVNIAEPQITALGRKSHEFPSIDPEGKSSHESTLPQRAIINALLALFPTQESHLIEDSVATIFKEGGRFTLPSLTIPRHLLSPLSTLPATLLNQQCHLLMLFVLAEFSGISVDFHGGEQSLVLHLHNERQA